MASKILALGLLTLMALGLAGCGEKVVKAGVPPPAQRQPGDPKSNLPPDRGARGGLGMPKELPKGPY